MRVEIHWDILRPNTIQNRQEKLEITNLLQSVPYVLTQAKLKSQIPRQGVVTRNGTEIGLVLAQEVSLFKGAIHAIILDRGPLWYVGENTPENAQSFFATLAEQYPRRFGRMRRIIPEIENSAQAQKMMTDLGYKPRAGQHYQTLILDLAQEEEALKAAMKKSWKSSLTKAGRYGDKLSAVWDHQGLSWPYFERHYMLDRRAKKYQGPSVKLMQALVQTFSQSGGLLIGYTEHEGRPVAGILILCDGNTATYQIGWNTEPGRECCAHHFLLWEAIKTLKNRGIRYLDLGGIHEEGAAGVTDFKKGLAGKKAKILELCGVYS